MNKIFYLIFYQIINTVNQKNLHALNKTPILCTQHYIESGDIYVKTITVFEHQCAVYFKDHPGPFNPLAPELLFFFKF